MNLVETCILGVDCATDPKKVGLAKCLLRGNDLILSEARIGSNTQGIAQLLSSWIEPSMNTLITIDAPLGWPKPLGETLFSHQAGDFIQEEANSLFRRETDRFIKRTLGKQSLDVGADRIARTARAALCILSELRIITEKHIPLAWEINISGLQAIEVYPAATLQLYGMPDKGYKENKSEHRRIREVIVDELDEYMEIHDYEPLLSNADILDATLCCLAGADFLLGKSIEPENLQMAKKEGWIWVKSRAR